MGDVAILAEGVGKQYRIGAKKQSYYSLRETLMNVLASPLRGLSRLGGKAGHEEEMFWALKDISFEVKHGEAIGIIGRNGAGKSTLLKILSRITEPTAGRARIYGRVGSLLEVGTGFHPELTGRENIFLNGAVLGMTKAEIKNKFDAIVDFSGIEKFLDTPVKRYSSGMYVRLAFSVAAHLEPEILLVDEVLAVGDAAFHKKCMSKMGSVATEGRTVLFVSHNMTAVQGLCRRVIWLQDGTIVESGPADQVTLSYLQAFSTTIKEQAWSDVSLAPGTDEVRLRRVAVLPHDAWPSDCISVRTPFTIEFDYWNLIPGTCLYISMVLYNEEGVAVLGSFPAQEPLWTGRPLPAGLFRSTCHLPGDLLSDGTYRVLLLVVKDEGTIIYRHEDILVFEVIDQTDLRGKYFGKWIGTVRPILKWQTELINENDPVAFCRR
jgi:lipopolysaccharide transport system ATP-binding protein